VYWRCEVGGTVTKDFDTVMSIVHTTGEKELACCDRPLGRRGEATLVDPGLYTVKINRRPCAGIPRK
jgi:hypothetical protein